MRIVTTVAIGLFFVSKLRVAPENTRFAVGELGNFKGFKGPGLLFKWKGAGTQWVRIRVGDRAEVTAAGVARFDDLDVPAQIDVAASIGDFVRATGFTDSSVLAIRDSNQAKVFICEKCGHENAIS